jgi:hypothetical protein
MKVNSAAVLCVLSVLVVGPTKAPTSLAPARKSPPARYGFPRLAPGQLWVSSVPVGLEVRSGENPNAKKVLGRTPLLLNARDVDRYVTVSIQKKQYRGQLPNQMDLVDFSAKMTHSMTIKSPTVEGDVGRAVTYELHLPDKQTVIALFQSRHLSLSDLARLYPTGSNFRFSDEAVATRLAQRGVPPEFVRAGIRLLHRGGKVALPGRQGWLVAEVTASGQVDVLDSPVKPVS